MKIRTRGIKSVMDTPKLRVSQRSFMILEGLQPALKTRPFSMRSMSYWPRNQGICWAIRAPLGLVSIRSGFKHEIVEANSDRQPGSAREHQK